MLGPDGAVLYDSATLAPASASDAERRALAAHRLRTSDAAILSPPFRLDAGGDAVTVSHRVTATDGSFAGIVVGTVRLHVFFEQFRDLKIGSHDLVGLFSMDGALLAYLPDDRFAGRSIAGSVPFNRFLGATSGTFVGPGVFDGSQRMFSFRRLPNWPLILSIGLSTTELNRSWHRRAVVSVSFLVLIVSLTLVLLWQLRRDVDMRAMAAEALAESENRYRLLAESSADMIVGFDRNEIRTYVSPSCRQFGYEPDELIGLPATSLIHDDDVSAIRPLIDRLIKEKTAVQIVYRLRHKSGRYTWAEANVTAFANGGGLTVIRDVDKRKREELQSEANRQALAHLAATDGLTRLANRRVFDEQLQRAWLEASRGTKPLSLLMLDVDHFKIYNDRHGHPAGDAVLVRLSQLISRNVRRAADIAARYGGEEFAVVLPATDVFGAIEVAEATRSAVWDAELAHAGSPLGRVTVSIGVATTAPNMDGGTAELLLKAADDELYRGKKSGRNRVYARALTPALHAEPVRDE